jgi:RNA polymerase sigma-70 factor (ECF subfamily)
MCKAKELIPSAVIPELSGSPARINCGGMLKAIPSMRALPEPSDSDLLQSMLAGDEAALAALYRRRQGSIYRFALQMSGSPALAEDVTQEVFLALMRDGTSYDAARGPLNWFLLGMARNLMRQRLGRERFYTSLEDNSNEHPVESELQNLSNPLDDLSHNETIESLRRAVLSLPPRYREVVVLCELQELSYAEAAGVLDCAIGTVRSRLHRARALLIGKMRPASEADPTAESVATARCFA